MKSSTLGLLSDRRGAPRRLAALPTPPLPRLPATPRPRRPDR
jgi:hypothetical protein